MASSIDDKVVSIKFDNAEFERNVQQTLKTLATLKASLDFKGSAAGLEDISNAASKFSLAGIGEAVDGIASKFSTMGAVAFSVINNLVSRAVDAGLAIGKQFTVQPVLDGFAEFELKMGSIQTIMAGSGEPLDVVNQKLQELNEYSDKTIYSFKDMTSNIGKFTNAGVSLDDSVASIQGIANVAAISGANAEEASRAMYNFAQALSSGSVKLMDWKSIELANMATVEFKTELLESAVAAGTLTKSADGLYSTLEGTPVSATQGFNESLSEQWLTTQALNDTLGRYADNTTDIGKRAEAAATDVKTFSQMMDTLKESAGSGWATTSELIFGDFEEGKKLWTDMNNSIGGFIGANADARNEVLQVWKDGGGRDLMIDSLAEAMKSLGEIIAPIKGAFREIFPATTGRDLLTMTVAFSNFVDKLKPSAKTVENLKSVFLGVFSAIKIVWEVVKGVIGVFTGLFGLFASGTSGGILSFFAKIGDAVNALRIALVDGGGIASLFEKINASIAGFITGLDFGPLINSIQTFVATIKAAFFYFTQGFSGGAAITEVVAERMGGIIAIAFKLGETFSKVSDSIKDFFGSIDFGPLTTAINAIKSVFSGLFGGEGLVPSAAGESLSAFSTAIGALGDVLSEIGSAIKSFFSGVGSAASAVKNIATSVSGALSDVWTSLKEGIGKPDFDPESLWAPLAALLSGGFLAVFAKFAKDGLKLDFGQGGIFKEIENSLGALTGNLKAMQTNVQADTIQKIAIAVGVLALSMIALSFVKGEDLAKSLTAMTVGLGGLIGALKALEQIADGASAAAKIILLSVALGILAISIIAIALAVKLLGSMNVFELAIGMTAVVVILKTLSTVADGLANNSENMIKAAASIFVIAGALIVLAVAVKMFSMMDPLEMAQGLIGIGVALGILALALNNMPLENMKGSAATIATLAVSLIILAVAIKMFADIGLEDMARGLLGVGASLTTLVFALSKMPENDIKKTGFTILLLALAMGKMAQTLEAMAGISWPDLIKGMLGLGLVLGGMILAMKYVESGLAGAAALLIVAASLLMMVEVFKQFANVPIEGIVIGLAAMAGVIGILALAGWALSPLLPVFIGFAAAVALFGIGVGAAGAGIFLFVRAIQILSEVGPAGIQAFLDGIVQALTIVPQLATAFGEAAFLFVTSFLSGFEELIPMVLGLLGQLLSAIREYVPEIVNTAVMIIEEFLGGIREIFPDIVETGFAMIVALLQGIRDNISEIASLGIGIVTELINGMAEGIPGYVKAIINLLTTMLETAVFEVGFLMVTLGPKLGISFIKGFLAGLETSAGLIKEFITGFVTDVIEWVKSGFGIFSPSRVMDNIGVQLILGLLQGLVKTVGKIATWFIGLVGEVLGWIGNAAIALVGVGSDLITGLLSGITTGIVAVTTFFTGLFSSIIGWVGDALVALASIGADLISGLFTGITTGMIVVTEFFTGLFSAIFGWIGDVTISLVSKGVDLITGLWTGIGDAMVKVIEFHQNLAQSIVGWVGNVVNTLKTKGVDFITGLFTGITEKAEDIWTWYRNLGATIRQKIGDVVETLKSKGFSLITGLFNGITEKAEDVWEWFGGLAGKIISALGGVAGIVGMLASVGRDIILGLWNGIQDKFTNFLKDKLGRLFGMLPGWVKDLLGIHSPSTVFMEIGKWIPIGFAKGVESKFGHIKTAAEDMAYMLTDNFNPDSKTMTETINQAVSDVVAQMEMMEDFTPTITPVLDLTGVQRDIKTLNGLMPSTTLDTNNAFRRASAISTQTQNSLSSAENATPVGPTEIKFEQNNYSPTALATNDIYRQTRSQIALAKLEYDIP